MDRRRRLERDIKALTWEEFQRLVHDLVKTERPNARPLAAPDGGADTLIPAKGGRATEVVQAKHYPDKIHFGKCVSSLKTALEKHAPKTITFAFSKDFTANEEREFRKKLVESFPEVEVSAWTLTDLIERLDRHPDVKKRHLGRDHEEGLDSILRTIQHGGKLETGSDLIERAHSLARFADEHDVDFRYRTTEGEASMPAPSWPELPFMGLTIADETTAVRVDAWAREDVNVPPAAFWFTDDDEGQKARGRVREELAAGREAIVRAGVSMTIPKPPKVMAEALEDRKLESPEITISPGDPLTLDVVIETAEDRLERSFAVRPVPPLETGHVSLACLEGALFVELDFHALEEPTVEFSLRVSGRFREDVAENVDAARFLDLFYSNRRVGLRCERLFPSGELEGQFNVGREDDRQAITFRREVYEDLALIEERAGVDFTLPERFGDEDLAAIGTVVKVLETGEGTATFENATGIVEANEIAWIAERFREQRVVRRPIVYDVLGERVELGLGEYELPSLEVIDVKPLGMTPDSPAHVTIGPAGENQMRFRLLESAPRAA